MGVQLPTLDQWRPGLASSEDTRNGGLWDCGVVDISRGYTSEASRREPRDQTSRQKQRHGFFEGRIKSVPHAEERESPHSEVIATLSRRFRDWIQQ